MKFQKAKKPVKIKWFCTVQQNTTLIWREKTKILDMKKSWNLNGYIPYSFDLTRKIKIICEHRRFLNFWKIAKENEILLFLWSFFFHYDSIIFWCFFSFTRARSLFDDNMILHSIGESSITATAVGKQLLFGNIGSANSFFGTGWTWTWAAIVTGNTWKEKISTFQKSRTSQF